jgi:antirestriction protein ArdC
MMFAAERAIPHDPTQHAAYVESWIKALKNDKNEIFRAASGASDAVDYVLQRQREKPQKQPAELNHVARAANSRAAYRRR